MYRLYKCRTLTALVYACVIVLCLLALFEKPAPERMEAAFWVTVTIELLCVGFFLFRFVHEVTFTKREEFWRDTKHFVVLGMD